MAPLTVDAVAPHLDRLKLVHKGTRHGRPGGALTLSVVKPRDAAPGHPAVYFIHGGMIFDETAGDWTAW